MNFGHPVSWCKKGGSIKSDPLEQSTRSRLAQLSPMCWPCKSCVGPGFPVQDCVEQEKVPTVAGVSVLFPCWEPLSEIPLTVGACLAFLLAV